jgi:iron(II)-dependent oxidoreductase
VRREAMYDRPIAERHRIIFYVGHLEAFDRNLLHENVFGLASFQPEFDRLFAFGIDPVGGGLPTDQPSEWPSFSQVEDYVRRIRTALDEKLADGIVDSADRRREGFSLETLLNVAIEHRLMHVETLAYMLHQLPLDRKVRHSFTQSSQASPVTPRMIEIPAGPVSLGLPRDGNDFGWDNEFDSHVTQVPAYSIDQYMVTNGQFLEFLESGGYHEKKFWNEGDWNWIGSQNISHPAFWNKTGDGWVCRTMFDDVPLPMDWPVYVSQAEASAYARWAGKALPTEEQWQRAAYGTLDGKQRMYPWGDQAPAANLGNFDFYSGDPAPVNAFPQGQSAFGVEGMVGNGWEWTSTAFGPFAGFQAFPFYPGYSANFFDGKHFVMKGGSARTAACMLRPSFRNWFQAHYQFVYAGFRCVNSIKG